MQAKTGLLFHHESKKETKHRMSPEMKVVDLGPPQNNKHQPPLLVQMPSSRTMIPATMYGLELQTIHEKGQYT
jgi:hypothetical protein